MKKLILIVLGVIVVLIGAALALPFVIPTETYKEQLSAQVERATGRRLEIEGPLHVSLLPSVALQARDVRFANAPGAAEPDMAKLKELQVELKVWPLLRGSVEVARFVLVEPVIHLEVAKNGQPNWQFGALSAGGPKPAAAGGNGASGSSSLPISEIRLGDIRIENGTLTYADARSGASERIEAINLSVQLPDLHSPLQANGSLDYKGQTVKVDAKLEKPLEVIQGGRSPLRLAVDAKPARFGFDGQLNNGAEPSAAGGLDLSVPSIRDLAAWLAQPLDFQGEGLQTLTIKGKLDGSPKRVALSDVAIALDKISGKGELVADLGGQVPKVTCRLDLGAVDLNPYLPPSAAKAGQPAMAGEQPAGGQPPSSAGGGPAAPAGQPPAAQTAAAGWSDEPIALPPLGAANVAFELTLASLRVQALDIGRTVLGLTLQDGTLEAALKELALYGGHGSGTVRVAVENGAPAIRQQFKLDGLQAQPFLSAAAGFERLEGTAGTDFSLTSRGRSERELVQNLNGDGKIAFKNGAIVGINIAAMVRNAANAFLDAGASETRKTDFAELGGTFKIRQGILTNDDMQLQAPTLRLTGSGQVNLPKRTVDYRIEPKAAPTLEGQGGQQQVAGLLVPVIIRGPWDHLTYTPDLSGVVESALKNPEAVKKQLDQLDDQAKDLKRALKDATKQKGSSDALVEGLSKALGGDQQAPSSAGTDKQPDKKPDEPVQKLLKGLLGN
jgi:AsmA protein